VCSLLRVAQIVRAVREEFHGDEVLTAHDTQIPQMTVRLPAAPIRTLRHTTFRFYEELNDFLPVELRKTSFDFSFTGTPSVKDSIEAIGVPHPEVDLILVDGRPVGFDYLIAGGERVAVYPMFERFDIGAVNRLRPEPLRIPRFVLDVHLGKLARSLRLLGFDTLYRNDFDDATIVRLSTGERRIILTRDRGLLKHRLVTRGHWLRSSDPSQQILEVIEAFDLGARIRPFTRCLMCNTPLRKTTREAIAARLPARLDSSMKEFAWCPGCDRVYWPGTHYERLRALLQRITDS
jgi:uncharacterized protein with PIN domain